MATPAVSTRYEVLEGVGDGAVFQVYKARDRATGRILALKVLQPAYAQDKPYCAALRRAASRLSSLAHPNIARIEDVTDDGGAPYVVTEFARGINLSERIRRVAPFTLPVAVDFAVDIAEALQYAHAQGVVHGDLRPHNVIVSPEGLVKVTDFGLAQVSTAAGAAVSPQGLRSAPYAAPEVSAGTGATPSSDIYALGAILFEMLTATAPYGGETVEAIAEGHRTAPVPSARAINSTVPRSLDGIATKALQKRPNDRYHSAAEMLTDLKAVRDALRFGKSLSWSPMEPGASSGNGQHTAAAVEPAAPRNGAESEEAAPMAATRAADDSISPFLRAAIYIVMFILMVSTIGLVAFWMTTFQKVPAVSFPDLKGMKIEDARNAAAKAGVKLLEHDQYNEEVPRGLIYQTDLGMTAGRPIMAGRHINVWVSRGSRMVYVPDLVGLDKDEAQQKLQEAGMILGDVNRVNDARIPFDHIVSQNPRARKRVSREVPLNLTISDGPKPDETQPTPEGGDNGTQQGDQTGTNGTDATGGSGPDQTAPNGANAGPAANAGGPGAGAAGDNAPDSSRSGEVHTVNLTKRIPHDGQGVRRVRIEYDDALGTHTPVDEYWGEGATVTQRVDVYGPKVTVRVYYGDGSSPVSSRNMTFPKPQ